MLEVELYMPSVDINYITRQLTTLGQAENTHLLRMGKHHTRANFTFDLKPHSHPTGLYWGQ